ncbi:hypothetical protein GYMLUDRAFT_248336 [Collybiopsis luxurians FD-317 M1]|uniref:Uncharacterized protein n=1 Tax=Collybiopsis luxurians FD-317 M1 TaxID=944289 RepID=A0A0D0BM66_9AGAR|nr:hypothetical protein GYMLUDRAFT_248336 [Collybiopsis luxurians FD-317 M1]
MNLLGIPPIILSLGVGYLQASPTIINAIQYLHKSRGYDPTTTHYVHSQGLPTFCVMPGYGSEMLIEQETATCEDGSGGSEKEVYNLADESSNSSTPDNDSRRNVDEDILLTKPMLLSDSQSYHTLDCLDYFKKTWRADWPLIYRDWLDTRLGHSAAEEINCSIRHPEHCRAHGDSIEQWTGDSATP